MTNRRRLIRYVAAAVAISTVAIIVRTHGTDALNPEIMSGKIAAVADSQMQGRGYDPHLTNTACSPLHGNDPAEANNWDCSALDHWGDLVRFSASDRYGKITVGSDRGDYQRRAALPRRVAASASAASGRVRQMSREATDG
jgi:hypothetical protein